MQENSAGKGAGPVPAMRNDVGAYDCFLNSAVQCLWNSRQFRKRFKSLACLYPFVIEVESSTIR